MLKLIVKIEETEAEGVGRMIEGHLHVQTVLSDVQVPRLPDCEEEGPRMSTQRPPRHHRAGKT